MKQDSIWSPPTSAISCVTPASSAASFRTSPLRTPNAACLTLAPAPFYATPGVGYTGVIRYTDSNAMMNYNAMQASFRQRAWHGLQYTANYT